MGKKAQALLELSLFLGLMLMVLLAALSYQRNSLEQKENDKRVFDQVFKKANLNSYVEKDIDDKDTQCSGAIVSYSLNADRQANRLFQGGQRRTAASSTSLYWSNAESPKDYEYNYYNKTDIGSEVNPALKKKIFYPRPGSSNPEDDMKLSTADYIFSAYPMVSDLTQGAYNLFSSTPLSEAAWWKSWGGYLDFIIRTAAFIYFAAKYAAAINRMAKAEADRQALEDQDKQMGEWGWRVPDWVHDRSYLCPGITGTDPESKAACEKLLGVQYVKEISAQVWDIESEDDKSIDYTENQTQSSSVRNVNVGHNVKRAIRRRFDETKPDPTIPLGAHDLKRFDEKEVNVDLSGGQSETWGW